MDRRPGVVGEAVEKLEKGFTIDLANFVAGESDVPVQAGATGKVDHHARECFVEGDVAVSVAGDPRFVSQRDEYGLSQGDAAILDTVVTIDMEIALYVHIEVEKPVMADLLEHMIEKADAAFQRTFATAVEIKCYIDAGFRSIARDFRRSAHFYAVIVKIVIIPCSGKVRHIGIVFSHAHSIELVKQAGNRHEVLVYADDKTATVAPKTRISKSRQGYTIVVTLAASHIGCEDLPSIAQFLTSIRNERARFFSSLRSTSGWEQFESVGTCLHSRKRFDRACRRS